MSFLNRREALATLAGPAFAAREEARPNIVFVLVDDLRYDALGCTGHPFARTPNIDRIAKEGVTFGNAFVTTPLCSPARASFLTGRYVHAHGVAGNTTAGEPISYKLETFPMKLHDAGYETAFIGKWHMGRDDAPRPGFDHWVSFRGQGVYNDPPMNVDGRQEKLQGYVTDILTDFSVKFIERARSKPFCLYLSHKAIHGPFTPAARHKDLYSDQPISRRANANDDLSGKPALRRNRNAERGRGPGDDVIRNQLRCLASIDESTGRILQTLEKAGQLDRTLVVFTSDNGYLWGEHGLGDKRAGYEESIRIPLLMRYPALFKAGRKTSELALNVDIAPTMIELGRARPAARMHGRSLLDVARGKAKNWRSSFLAEYFAEPQFPRVPTWQAVRTERYKYIHYTELEGMDELYDLKRDPLEMKNLVADASMRATSGEMVHLMQSLLKETR